MEKLQNIFIPSRKLYPRAHEANLPINHPSIRGPRRGFFKAAAKNFILLQLLFLGLFAYIFGALFQQGDRVHFLNVLFVDYDGGAVGESVRTAYGGLKGNGFFTLVERPSSEVEERSLRSLVCGGEYWATLGIEKGASGKIEAGLRGTGYEKEGVMSYIWNEALYSSVVDSAISANLVTLSSAARVAYSKGNFTDIPLTPNSISVFADPWHLKSINIQPTTQGSRAIYNTLVIILILIQEFFYLGTINGLYDAFKIYSRLNPHRIIIFRSLLSLAYCFIGSLCVAGSIWAFKSGWHVNTAQFFLTWAALWLFAHLNFLTFDVFTIWLPMPFVPMALISWVILNVASILLPFELSAGFYRWGYVMPAHEVYLVLIDIWSGGCNPTLRYSLPILFAYEISGLFLSGLGVHRRCHYAVIKEEGEKAAFQAKIDAALEFERTKGTSRRMASTATGGRQSVEDKIEPSDEIQREEEREREDAVEEALEREELSGVIERETTRMRREQSKGSRAVDFGPSFGFRFGAGEESE